MSGFFISNVVESITAYSGRGPFSPFHDAAVSSDAAAELPERFAGSGAPHHLCLDGVLTAPCAEAIARGPLLRRFVDWLRSERGGAFHREWAGWPPPAWALQSARVDVLRLAPGEALPVQDDPHDGLCALYMFAGGGTGGRFRFPKRRGHGTRLELAERFNRVLVLRTLRAPYALSRSARRGSLRLLIRVTYRFGLAA